MDPSLVRHLPPPTIRLELTSWGYVGRNVDEMRPGRGLAADSYETVDLVVRALMQRALAAHGRNAGGLIQGTDKK